MSKTWKQIVTEKLPKGINGATWEQTVTARLFGEGSRINEFPIKIKIGVNSFEYFILGETWAEAVSQNVGFGTTTINGLEVITLAGIELLDSNHQNITPDDLIIENATYQLEENSGEAYLSGISIKAKNQTEIFFDYILGFFVPSTVTTFSQLASSTELLTNLTVEESTGFVKIGDTYLVDDESNKILGTDTIYNNSTEQGKIPILEIIVADIPKLLTININNGTSVTPITIEIPESAKRYSELVGSVYGFTVTTSRVSFEGIQLFSDASFQTAILKDNVIIAGSTIYGNDA